MFELNFVALKTSSSSPKATPPSNSPVSHNSIPPNTHKNAFKSQLFSLQFQKVFKFRLNLDNCFPTAGFKLLVHARWRSILWYAPTPTRTTCTALRKMGPQYSKKKTLQLENLHTLFSGGFFFYLMCAKCGSEIVRACTCDLVLYLGRCWR